MSDLPDAFSWTSNLESPEKNTQGIDIEAAVSSYRKSRSNVSEAVAALSECCAELEAGVPRLKKAIEDWFDHDEEFANDADTPSPPTLQ